MPNLYIDEQRKHLLLAGLMKLEHDAKVRTDFQTQINAAKLYDEIVKLR